MKKNKKFKYFISYYAFDQTATGFGNAMVTANRAIEDDMVKTNGDTIREIEAKISEDAGLPGCKILFFQRL